MTSTRALDGPEHFSSQRAYNDGYDARTLRLLTTMVEAHKARIERAWHEYFG